MSRHRALMAAMAVSILLFALSSWRGLAQWYLSIPRWKQNVGVFLLVCLVSGIVSRLTQINPLCIAPWLVAILILVRWFCRRPR